MYGYCKICERRVTPEYKMLQDLYEYSVGKVLLQYFYNDTPTNRESLCSIPCFHRIHRDINR